MFEGNNMGMSKTGLLIIGALVIVLLIVCANTSRKDGFNSSQPEEPVVCKWLADQMYEGNADPRLIENARDTCLNYRTLCGRASAGAEVLSIYDNFGNNWEAAVDILAQDMDAAGKDKTQCMTPLTCDARRAKCPAFLQCTDGACQ